MAVAQQIMNHPLGYAERRGQEGTGTWAKSGTWTQAFVALLGRTLFWKWGHIFYVKIIMSLHELKST